MLIADRLDQHGVPVKVQKPLLAAGEPPTLTAFVVSMPIRRREGR